MTLYKLQNDDFGNLVTFLIYKDLKLIKRLRRFFMRRKL